MLSKARVSSSFWSMFSYTALQVRFIVSSRCFARRASRSVTSSSAVQLFVAGPCGVGDHRQQLRHSICSSSAVQSTCARRHEDKRTRGVRYVVCLSFGASVAAIWRTLEFFCGRCWPILLSGYAWLDERVLQARSECSEFTWYSRVLLIQSHNSN